MTSTNTQLSPADFAQELVWQAAWRAYEEERETFLNERHYQALRAGAVHGTRQAYQRRNGQGCRCYECKVANAEYLREYRERKKTVTTPEPKPDIRTGKYPVIETEHKEPPKDIKRPKDINATHEREEEFG